jgi:hypothetical protein
MFLRLTLLTVLIFLSASMAHAAEYVAPNWENLTRTLVRFNAINLSDQVMVDEYSIVTECEIYKAFFKDDFKWNEVRSAVRQSVAANVATFPAHYQYDVPLLLDHYDFDRKIYRFTQKSALRNVNTFVLFSVLGTGCGAADVQYLPRTFRAVLAAPIYLEGLPLAENDAKALAKQMSDSKNVEHVVFSRFNVSVVYVEPIRKVTDAVGKSMRTLYRQSNASTPDTVRLDVRLDSIDFFADPAMTRLVYQYQP